VTWLGHPVLVLVVVVVVMVLETAPTVTVITDGEACAAVTPIVTVLGGTEGITVTVRCGATAKPCLTKVVVRIR
jgi:hypothetical protein